MQEQRIQARIREGTWIMPEQQRIPEQAEVREQHLYLVFDDWHSGYSIRKVNLLSHRSSLKRSRNYHHDQHSSSSSSSGASAAGEDAEPVPEVVIRIRAKRGWPKFITSAFGPKIMVMFPSVDYTPDKPVIPMFDVEDLVFEYAPIPSYHCCPIYFRVGDRRLYVMDFSTFTGYLWKPEVQNHGDKQLSTWESQDLPHPSPLFDSMDVSSHGVLPDGCLFVSTKSGAAFIFDTTKESDQSAVWEPYGDWALPFTGCAHYDTSLEGFVGLSRDPKTFGYLYCSKASTTVGSTGKTTLHPSPDGFKRSKETLYSKNPAERHESATLLHMCPGEFCLVECVSSIADEDGIRDDGKLRVPLGADEWDFVGGGPQAGRFCYRVKTFSLGYDKEGDLEIKHREARCFSLPHEARIGSLHQDPAAFWL